MTVNERVKYIYDECRKVGITHHGACGLLGNLQGENSEFNPMRLETLYLNRFGLTSEEYTRRADAGEKVYNDKTFVYDSAGYGIAQWTWWSRKKGLLDYAKKIGKSVGDLTTQVAYMFTEMQTNYTKTWKTLTTTNDYKEAVKICVNEYEKPANAAAAIQTRCTYALAFLDAFADTKTEEKTETAASPDKAIAALIATARAELGYLEKKNNSLLEDKTANAGSNNYNKYAAQIDANYPAFYNGKKNGYAWCDVFVDWCFIQTFGYEKALELLCAKEKSSGAGCIYSADYYRAKGQFYKSSPKVGDQIFFGRTGNETHTGLVVAVSSDTVTTIEGNTSSASGVVANGGAVCEKSYPINNYYIVGYGRPNYSLVEKVLVEVDKPDEKPVEVEKPVTETNEKDVVDVKLNTLRQGDKGQQVKAMQMLIIGSGYSCGSAGADGDFGSGTLYGLKLYQKAKRLEADGICGVNTWTKLLKG